MSTRRSRDSLGEKTQQGVPSGRKKTKTEESKFNFN